MNLTRSCDLMTHESRPGLTYMVDWELRSQSQPVGPLLDHRAGRPLARNTTSSYLDETYMPSGSDRPNARVLSNELFMGDGKPRPSVHNKTALFAFFGEYSLNVIFYLFVYYLRTYVYLFCVFMYIYFTYLCCFFFEGVFLIFFFFLIWF